jgi:hypothetical protein
MSMFSKCDHGRWVCTNRTCPRTCLVLGDMNIMTFDGKQYGLVSKCNQVLVEVFIFLEFLVIPNERIISEHRISIPANIAH